MRRVFFLPLVFPLLMGCSSRPYKVASVSGKVTLNGQPLAHASVVFSPIPAAGEKEPGPDAGGITDSEGRYTLKITTPNGTINGAVVGKHKVRITFAHDTEDSSDDSRPQPAKPTAKKKAGGRPKQPVFEGGHEGKDKQLDCEVPPGGRDDANFDLKTP